METSRRNFMSGIAMAIGTAMTPLGALAFEAAMSMDTNKRAGVNGNSLSKHQLTTLAQVVETIIPTTDTPGAEKANVHHFINHILSHFFSTQQKEDFLNGLVLFDNKAKGFITLANKEQLSFLNALDKNRQHEPFYMTLKELTVIGYYTSEIGASQELNLSLIHI